MFRKTDGFESAASANCWATPDHLEGHQTHAPLPWSDSASRFGWGRRSGWTDSRAAPFAEQHLLPGCEGERDKTQETSFRRSHGLRLCQPRIAGLLTRSVMGAQQRTVTGMIFERVICFCVSCGGKSFRRDYHISSDKQKFTSMISVVLADTCFGSICPSARKMAVDLACLPTHARARFHLPRGKRNTQF
mmetsp:Transcript_65393/g.173345  ORF Transcript_65393/g.173345 Transcript_65393/m.173345 type:complete len:190 (+) Transcript_65393:1708-2277(+)